MKPIKATRCARCPRAFDDATGAEIHPEVANAVGWCVCPACFASSAEKVKAEVEAMRQRALADLAGRKLP